MWWEERTNPYKFSSDLHIHVTTHMYTHTYMDNKNNGLNGYVFPEGHV